MSNTLKEDLTKLGLTDKESRVYLALLSLGTATTEKLAKESKLNRSTTYVQLLSLVKKGLISTFKEGKKTLYNVESPNNLEKLLDGKMLNLQQQKTYALGIIPQLMEQFVDHGARPSVRVFEGKAGLTSLRNEVLDMKSKEYMAATSMDHLTKIFSEKELSDFSKERSRKKIKSFLLYTSSSKKEIRPLQPQEIKKVAMEDFPFSADVYVYDEKVAFVATSGKVVGVIIESQSISQSVAKLFQLAWIGADASQSK